MMKKKKKPKIDPRLVIVWEPPAYVSGGSIPGVGSPPLSNHCRPSVRWLARYAATLMWEHRSVSCDEVYPGGD